MTSHRVSVVCSLMLSVACSAENPQPKAPNPAPTPAVGGTVRDGIPPAVASDTAHEPAEVNIDTLEASAIRPVSDLVARVGSELRIRLKDGRTAILQDDTTAGLAFALPRYAGYLRTIHSHVIHQYQYEGEGVYFVLDDSTGDSTLVFGMPVVSPDAQRFAVTSMEGMEGGNPGRIEIWHMVGRTPEKEFTYDTESEPWEASDPVWRDSVTVDFFKNEHSSPGDPYVQTPGRLKRTGPTWSLVDVSR